MDTFITLTKDERKTYCNEAQSKLGLPPASVEKDFWVCWTLRELFNLPEIGSHLTFKGGTSLSKAWKLINRFSEDIEPCPYSAVLERMATASSSTISFDLTRISGRSSLRSDD